MQDQLTLEALEVILASPDVEIFFEAHDLDTVAADVFELFDADLDGFISVSEFIYGCQYCFLAGGTFDNFGMFHLSEQVAKVSLSVRAVKDKTQDVARLVHQHRGMGQVLPRGAGKGLAHHIDERDLKRHDDHLL
eukprot:CAMPEP_0169391032 /NCGR_PEP_ID=MMETSP1017-20121227/47750_1 /TAXON_ID=342587 /ORGANISM="Karlodinium micrum, Strain CCMP2283" /LENGTH=134 /DNA_ID=CAMNT_0009493641 /DNA_START=231 /DNA_END=635 /DNA_ORIENTATION=-